MKDGRRPSAARGSHSTSPRLGGRAASGKPAGGASRRPSCDRLRSTLYGQALSALHAQSPRSRKRRQKRGDQNVLRTSSCGIHGCRTLVSAPAPASARRLTSIIWQDPQFSHPIPGGPHATIVSSSIEPPLISTPCARLIKGIFVQVHAA